jgi:ABC-type uncharacterized transport system substrate-binding protein
MSEQPAPSAVRHLRDALVRRGLVNQAIGVLIGPTEETPAEGRRRLQALAEETGLEVVDLAALIMSDRL